MSDSGGEARPDTCEGSTLSDEACSNRVLVDFPPAAIDWKTDKASGVKLSSEHRKQSDIDVSPGIILIDDELPHDLSNLHRDRFDGILNVVRFYNFQEKLSKGEDNLAISSFTQEQSTTNGPLFSPQLIPDSNLAVISSIFRVFCPRK